jgi:hypothetical protein
MKPVIQSVGRWNLTWYTDGTDATDRMACTWGQKKLHGYTLLADQTTVRSRDMTAPGRRCSPVMSHRTDDDALSSPVAPLFAAVSLTGRQADQLHSSKRHTPSGKSKTSLRCKVNTGARPTPTPTPGSILLLLFANTIRYYSLQYGHAQLLEHYAASSSPLPQLTHPTIRPRLPSIVAASPIQPSHASIQSVRQPLVQSIQSPSRPSLSALSVLLHCGGCCGLSLYTSR